MLQMIAVSQKYSKSVDPGIKPFLSLLKSLQSLRVLPYTIMATIGARSMPTSMTAFKPLRGPYDDDPEIGLADAEADVELGDSADDVTLAVEDGIVEPDVADMLDDGDMDIIEELVELPIFLPLL